MDKLEVRHTYDFEMLQTWPSMMLQLQGIHTDVELQKAMKSAINQRITEIDNEVQLMVGGNKPVNMNSTIELQKLLYTDIKMPKQYIRRKSRHDARKLTTNAEALTKLKRKSDNIILDKIIEYKKLKKLITFIDVKVSPEGKVHTSYNITGATMLRNTKKGTVIDDDDSYKSFGRWSSSKSIILPYGSGNLQNIPKEARRIYTAPPGYVFLQADYVQAEAVVVAYEIRDELLMKMFKDSFGLSKEERSEKNYDIHKATACTMFQVSVKEVTSEMRRVGKLIRHACNYSAGPQVVATQLGCSMSEAAQLISQFHNNCPQLRLWHKDLQKELARTKTLTNLLGRKHKFNDRWGDSLFRSAASYIPQSTVGDLLNTALIRFYYKYGSEVSICLQLHDAIYIYSKASDKEIASNINKLRDCMLMPLRSHGEEFVIDVDFAVGANWREMEEI
jgi:DNA polymerase-1